MVEKEKKTNEKKEELKKEQLNEVLRIKIIDVVPKVVNDKTEQHIEIDEQKLDFNLIKMRESELTRIIKHISPISKDCKNSDYCYVRDLLILKVGKSYKRYQDFTDGIIHLTVNDTDGKPILKDIKYKRLMASAGNIRSGKVVFVREDIFDKVNENLLCGIPKDIEFKSLAKYNAYYGLAMTDTTPVTLPNIVVVNDYEREIEETFDVVTGSLTHGNFNLATNKQKYCIKPFDGAGLIDVSLATRWAKELNLDYIPSSFQIRALPGVKGCLFTFNIQKFAESFNGKNIVDAWGNTQPYNNDINVILTKSQFKFFDCFKSFNEWYTAFTTPINDYTNNFGVKGFSENPKKLSNRVQISYQPLQSLNIPNEHIPALCADTVDLIKRVHNNIDEFIQYRGLRDEDNPDWSYIPPFYKAITKNKNLVKDAYIEAHIKNDLKSIKYKAYSGKLFINGNYQIACPDIFALAQYTFGHEVKGLIGKGKIYSTYWLKHKVFEVDIIRNPHVAREHYIARIICDKAINEWFKYQTSTIVTNINDSMAQRLNGADYDGDTFLTTDNKIIVEQAKAEPSNTVIYIPCESSKSQRHKINDLSALIETDAKGMDDVIGVVVNKITTLWSLPQTDTTQKYIKIMSIIASLAIDYAKTGERAKIPREINSYLKGIKPPVFKMYRSINDIQRHNNLKANAIYIDNESKINDKLKYVDCNCTVNLISRYIRNECDSLIPSFGCENYNFTDMLSTDKPPYLYSDIYKAIKAEIINLQDLHSQLSSERQIELKNSDGSDNIRKDYLERYCRFYSYCRARLLTICPNINKLIDCLIVIYYADKEFRYSTDNKSHKMTITNRQDKGILWNAFAREMVRRASNKPIKNNELDVESIKKLEKRSKKIDEKIKKAKKSTNKVDIKYPSPKKHPGTNKEYPDMAAFDNEDIIAIRRLSKNYYTRRLLYVLLALNQKLRGNKLIIARNKKGRVNKTQLCKLADISDTSFKKALLELIENEVVEVNLQVTSDLLVKINFEYSGGENKDISIYDDINECSKIVNRYFRQNKQKSS